MFRLLLCTLLYVVHYPVSTRIAVSFKSCNLTSCLVHLRVMHPHKFIGDELGSDSRDVMN